MFVKVWENLQYIVLALTIAGQIIIGADYIFGQIAWLVANIIAVVRDFILKRPHGDIVKDAAMTGLTVGLITAYLLGWY